MNLPTSANKAAYVEEMFDRIAPRYDLLNRLLTFRLDQRWRRLAVKRLKIGAGDTVVDLGCGTGDLSELAAETGARVIGIDYSAGMLRGMQKRGIQVQPVRADASLTPIQSRSVDVVLSSFALRNFVSIEAVFAEISRVLIPGGRIGLIEVDEPTSALLRKGHDLYFNKFVPLVGSILSDADAYRYLPESTTYLPDTAAMRELMKSFDWQNIEKTSLSGGVTQLLTATR